MSEFLDTLNKAQELSEERKYYFNGFTISVAPPDISLVIQHNEKIIAYLNTSHTIAKTLAETIIALISDFEEKTDQKILTLGEIQNRINKSKK